MSQLLNGSLCLTDIIAKLTEGHSAFSKAKNGKIYFNITQWINDEKDKYGNESSLLLNSTKEKKDAEGKFYIGHAKFAEKQVAEAPKQDDVSNTAKQFEAAANAMATGNAPANVPDEVETDLPF